jgi:regulator of RNase E activity RraA
MAPRCHDGAVNDLFERFLAVDTTAICDADRSTRVVHSAIRPRSATTRVFGPAFTVRCREDFLAVLRAVETAGAGAVIVVDGVGAGSRRHVVDGGYRIAGWCAGL